MTTLEKAQFITNREGGIGLSVNTLARYAKYHPSTISHYINESKEGNPRLERSIEIGIQEWYEDVKKFIASF